MWAGLSTRPLVFSSIMKHMSLILRYISRAKIVWILTDNRQMYMPITYALNTFGLSFATLSSLLVWLLLEKHHFLLAAFQRLCTTIARPFTAQRHFPKTTPQAYQDVSTWWYVASSAVAIFLSIFAVEFWYVQLRWYGVLLALAVTLVFYVPVS